MTRRLDADVKFAARELRSPREIRLMRRAGLLVWLAHQTAARLIRPGVCTSEIDESIARVFSQANAEPLFLHYPGPTPFPAVTCISVNEEIVHGIPGDRELQDGDIVSLDTGCRIEGWCGDAAVTHAVGKISKDQQRLLETTHRSLNIAIEACGTATTWSEIATQMQKDIEGQNCSIVRELVGHGIGRELHESPSVPNFYDPQHEDFTLRPGVVIAIEPMVNLGGAETKTLQDGWTVVTRDGKPSAHFEHTVALTGDGPIRLTGPPSEAELSFLPFDPGPTDSWINW